MKLQDLLTSIHNDTALLRSAGERLREMGVAFHRTGNEKMGATMCAEGWDLLQRANTVDRALYDYAQAPTTPLREACESCLTAFDLMANGSTLNEAVEATGCVARIMEARKT